MIIFSFHGEEGRVSCSCKGHLPGARCQAQLPHTPYALELHRAQGNKKFTRLTLAEHRCIRCSQSQELGAITQSRGQPFRGAQAYSSRSSRQVEEYDVWARCEPSRSALENSSRARSPCSRGPALEREETSRLRFLLQDQSTRISSRLGRRRVPDTRLGVLNTLLLLSLL